MPIPEEDIAGLKLMTLDQIGVKNQSDRFTVKLNAYWEHFGEQPVGQEAVASRMLDTQAVEPYVRKFIATETPKVLNLGDIERQDVGYLLVVNTEGTKLQRNPTPEEREAINAKIVTIDGSTIRPYGMIYFAEPTSDSPLMVRCLKGQAVLQVCIFPR